MREPCDHPGCLSHVSHPCEVCGKIWNRVNRTDEEIIQLVVIKAINNGFLGDKEWKAEPAPENHMKNYLELKHYYSLIFSHDFAKAFWGEKVICGYCGEDYNIPYDGCSKYCELGNTYPNPFDAWHYHLQEMVLGKEPLKYLEKFL